MAIWIVQKEFLPAPGPFAVGTLLDDGVYDIPALLAEGAFVVPYVASPQAAAGLRTLGTGHLEAAAGDDPRFGGATGSFDFTQSSPATTWVINHNLGFRPNVQARTVGGVLVSVDVVHTSVNQVVLSFVSATAGTARCS